MERKLFVYKTNGTTQEIAMSDSLMMSGNTLKYNHISISGNNI